MSLKTVKEYPPTDSELKESMINKGKELEQIVSTKKENVTSDMRAFELCVGILNISYYLTEGV
jgi:hypothetical protein